MARTKNSKVPMYTVYDNRTDFPVIVYAPAKDCARVMEISLNSFHHLISKGNKRGNRWHIMKDA